MTRPEPQSTEGKLPQPGVMWGPLGAMWRGRCGEVAPTELAAGVQALVAQSLDRLPGVDGLAEAADCIRLLWDVRMAHIWLPRGKGWESLPLHRGVEGDVAEPGVAEALSVAAAGPQRLEWPAAPHHLASTRGEVLGSAAFQPLVHQQEVVGVLSLHFLPARGFPSADAPLLVAVGRQLGVALALLAAQEESRQALASLMHETEQHALMRHAAGEAQKHLKEQVARLKHEDQVKTDFFARLSHELRSPLTTITGYGSMLDDGALGGHLLPEQGLAVRRMLSAADALSWLVEDLMDLARLRSGTFQLALKETHLAEILLEQGAGMAPLLDRSGLRLRVELGEPQPSLWVDPRRIAQALRNLLTNAVKHAPHGSVVTLRLKGEGGLQRMEVSDLGPGVPEAEREAIFLPYRQLGPTGQGESGLGLGLAIARRIVTAHQGRVGLCPHTEVGACFFIELPELAPRQEGQDGP